MSRGGRPIYEISYSISTELADEFDAWFSGQIRLLCSIDGVESARALNGGEDACGRAQRICWIHFTDDVSLASYLAGQQEEPGQMPFGDDVEASSRILRKMDADDSRSAETCRNCGTVLSGQYCGSCGQRARSRLISTWELVKEAFGDLFELDSRLWRTLIPLAVRPGRLTRDYLEGRRARFMPPFRTYLVLSIVFFLVAFFDPREQFSIFFAADETPAEPPAAAAQSTTPPPSAEQIRRQVFDDLAEQNLVLEPNGDIDPGETGKADGAPGNASDESEESTAFNIRFTDEGADTDADCENLQMENAPPWLATRLTPARLKVICERATADGGASLIGRILDNTPAALIFLLPLMALILKILYPLSKRYYVEHLLFVVHYHAFVFLILTLQIILSRLVSITGLPEAIASVGVAVVFFYVPIYLYIAIRRVYAQGHLLSSLKFFVLFMSYCAGLALIFLIVLLFSAFSI